MRKVLTTLAGFLLAAMLLPTAAAHAASVPPDFYSGNPTCQDLGYAYGLKPTPEATPNGTYFLNNGTDSVTVASNGTGLSSWSSTIGMDAVIVKGGPAANVYTYSPESMSDTNLVTPTNPNNNQPYGLSHVVFCYDYEVKVAKTAAATYTRSWSWTIDKSADASSLLLANGEVYPVGYTVTVGATHADSNYGASGTINVTNPDPFNSATITSISDQISGLLGTTPVICPVSLPYMLASGATMTCTYTQTLADATTRTNTATVATSGIVGGGSGTATITFGAPTTLVDECVDVSDTNYSLTPGTLCATEQTLPYTYNYTKDISYEVCGEHQYVNTASFITNDTQTTGSSSWTVAVSIPCATGCTLTQGYWKTHADITRKQYDNTWDTIGGSGTLFGISGTSWLNVFNTAPKGNPYYQFAHQYMAAKLNVANGASAPANVVAAIAYGDAWFSTHAPSSSISKSEKNLILSYASLLDQFNNGLLGTSHCSE